MNEIISVNPVFQENYDAGWCGFTFTDDDFISSGIAWFTRPDLLKPDKSPVSHALVVSGFNTCIEALPQGVVVSNLDKYFADPHCHIFFRKPVGYDTRMADRITDEAGRHIGESYGYGLIVADAMAGSFLGRVLNSALFNWPNRLVSKWFDGKKQQICSELAARSLQADPSLRSLGCLTLPPRMVTPRMLAFDKAVWTPLGEP